MPSPNSAQSIYFVKYRYRLDIGSAFDKNALFLQKNVLVKKEVRVPPLGSHHQGPTFTNLGSHLQGPTFTNLGSHLQGPTFTNLGSHLQGPTFTNLGSHLQGPTFTNLGSHLQGPTFTNLWSHLGPSGSRVPLLLYAVLICIFDVLDLIWKF